MGIVVATFIGVFTSALQKKYFVSCNSTCGVMRRDTHHMVLEDARSNLTLEVPYKFLANNVVNDDSDK